MRHRLIVAGLAVGALAVSSASAAYASASSTPRACAHPNGRVSAVAFSGTTAFLGGSFTKVTDRSGSARARAGLAAIDTTTCDLLPWKASTDGAVNAVTVTGGAVYVGGAFTHVNGAPRSHLAAVSARDGSLTSFAPRIDTPVRALASTSTTVFAGGDFTRVNATARRGLAAFKAGTGKVVSGWAPSVNREVDALEVGPRGHRLYLGGTFTNVNGDRSQRRLAAVSTSAGALAPFKARVGYPVDAIDADRKGVYVGTDGPGGHLLLLRQDGSAERAAFQLDGAVQSVGVDGDAVYAGGHFSNYCVGDTGSGQPFTCRTNLKRMRLMQVSWSTGRVTGWAPSLNSPHGVFVTDVDAGGRVWTGGDFTVVSGNTRQAHLAVFPGAG